MKKISLLVGAVVSLITVGQAQASESLVHEANEARAYAYHLNDHAAELEATVRHALKYGHNPVLLRKKAAALRRAATSLAWESNRLAKAYYNGHHY